MLKGLLNKQRLPLGNYSVLRLIRTPHLQPQGKVKSMQGIKSGWKSIPTVIFQNKTFCSNIDKAEARGQFFSGSGGEEIGTIQCAEHWCCLSNLLGYWTQSWMGNHSNTVYQPAGTHFADLRRMTGQVNPTWY